MASPQPVRNIPLVFAENLRTSDGRILDLTYKQERTGAYVQVAKLPEEPAFTISGTFNTAWLARGKYTAAFVIKIEGDHSPNQEINVELTVGKEQSRTVDLNKQDRDIWIKIESGPFENKNGADFEFRLTKAGNNTWKEHVFVNGIVVKPVI